MLAPFVWNTFIWTCSRSYGFVSYADKNEVVLVIVLDMNQMEMKQYYDFTTSRAYDARWNAMKHDNLFSVTPM